MEKKIIATYYIKLNNGGIERVVTQLLTLWDAMGYSTIVYTEEEESPLDYSYPKTVKRIIVNGESLAEKCEFLQKSLVENKVEYFVDHCWCHKIETKSRLSLAHDINVKYFLYIHGIYSVPYINFDDNSLLWNYVIKNADLVIVLNKMNQAFFSALGGKTKLINNPIQGYLLNSKEQSELNNHNILWIGRDDPGKHFADALKIFRLVKKEIKNTELHVVGDINVEKYKENIDGDFDSVVFHGYDTDVSKYYCNSSVMLLTSEAEGYCYTLLESKCFAVPIVMYSLPYLSLVKDSRGIVSVQQNNIEEAAKEICRLLNDNDYRKRMGEEARKSFESFAKYDYVKTWRDIFSGEYDRDIGIVEHIDSSMIINNLIELINVNRNHKKYKSIKERIKEFIQNKMFGNKQK